MNQVKLYKNQDVNNVHIIPKVYRTPHDLKDNANDIVMELYGKFFVRTWSESIENEWVELETIHPKFLANESLFVKL